MWNLYDIAYNVGLAVTSPYWLSREASRTKVQRALNERMGDNIPVRAGDDPCIMIHAVSVGEMNATRALVQKLRELKPNLKFYISATTETGYSRGIELYPPATGVTLIKYPLDFTSAIDRVLDAVRPTVVVLMELEVWPNFMLQCEKRKIPVILANARLTTSSFKHYKWGGPIIRKMFQRLALICAQDLTYAQRFLALGVKETHCVITGTMKFDNVNFAPPLPAARHRAEMLGLKVGDDLVWVCGSTGPGEEAMVLRVYRKLLRKFARLRLVIVPRHPPRFDEVAQIIEQHQLRCIRLSRVTGDEYDPDNALPPVVLIDAMGVLRDFYSVANVVFVGRSIVDLGPRQHGSDMIEPAALAKPTVIGPYTANFAEAVRKFLEADAMLEATDEESLEQSIAVLLSTPSEAMAMAARAREVVRQGQGATQLHVSVITQILQARLDEDFIPAAMTPVQRPAVPVGAPLPEPSRPPAVVTPPPPITPAIEPAPPPPAQPMYTTPPQPKKSPPKVIITSIGAMPPRRPGE